MSEFEIEKITVNGGENWNASHSVNFFVIYNGNDSILIDSGFPSGESLNRLKETVEKYNIKKAIISHYHEDHSGGVKFLLEKKIKVFYFNDLNIDEKHPLNNEQYTYKLTKEVTLYLDKIKLNILHTPGHAKGHISIYMEDEKILFSGDNIIGGGTTWIGKPDGDMITYINTLKRVLALKPEKIYPGHGEIIENPTEKIENLINHRLERENKIVNAMKKNNFSLDDITAEAYKEDKLPDYVVPFAKLTVLAHIEKLIKEERVVPVDPKNGIYKLHDR